MSAPQAEVEGMPNRKWSHALTVIVGLFVAASIPSVAHGSSGGLGPGTEGGTTVPGAKAKIVDGGQAVAPASAPLKVKKVIAAANEIENKPYEWGGGHGNFNDNGYDCSGAVSYALHGGGLLETPLDSTGLGKWGERGQGSWITVYGARSHAYIVVAGLRFDTSMTAGNGPGWSASMRSTPEKYRVRHPGGL